MPVQKFRSFEDASRALAVDSERQAGRLEARIAHLWSLSAALTPPLNFRGLRKYRSLDEADEDRRRKIVARPHRAR